MAQPRLAFHTVSSFALIFLYTTVYPSYCATQFPNKNLVKTELTKTWLNNDTFWLQIIISFSENNDDNGSIYSVLRAAPTVISPEHVHASLIFSKTVERIPPTQAHPVSQQHLPPAHLQRSYALGVTSGRILHALRNEQMSRMPPRLQCALTAAKAVCFLDKEELHTEKLGSDFANGDNCSCNSGNNKFIIGILISLVFLL